MPVSGYSPYKEREFKKKRLLKMPRFQWKAKKAILIVLGVLFSLFILAYLSLGQLRFFVNHPFGFGFFQKNYLVLLQNNYEMRPGGGFITGYGELSMRMGMPSNLSFFNSYDIDTNDYITPPYPHEELLKNEWYQGYSFRDANWSPHSPDNAASLLEFYQQKFPEKEVDGIVVVNFSLIEALVGQLGGIELNGKTITQENLFKVLTDSVNDVDRHSEEALANRKSILPQLIGPLMSQIKRHPFKARSVLVEGLNHKNIYMWMANDRMQSKLEARGWANTLTLPEASDFLAVNVANLGAKKTDRYLLKEVHHHVNLKADVPELTTAIKLHFPGQKNVYADDYKGYLRLYLPGGAEITQNPDDTRIEEEGDFKVLGKIIKVEAGQTLNLSFTYQLPRSLLNNNEYRLKLHKQSGDMKRYVVTVENNADHGVESDDFVALENKAIWEGYLQNDTHLRLQFLEDETAPYPIEQVFDNLGAISIIWSEPISPSSGGDALNYQVIDLDRENTDVTDEVKVTYAEVVGGNISRLELEGVTAQNMERYQIILNDIRDLSNNPISPSPKAVTAVQRFDEG